ncbi:hypothetical protein EHO59_00330 [Leptospira semungkisensis]|uniref:Uncharacterized protein n=1 Tax=Leptospira semungkisensis TaxID=2484985 RepID=A0A4R9G616_9LEPT|nr:hypothetical protein [Leptospira semungkisensis]TGK06625.1 hypothetical protein EHO59_00330 [Leptospira semungkisensis]
MKKILVPAMLLGFVLGFLAIVTVFVVLLLALYCSRGSGCSTGVNIIILAPLLVLVPAVAGALLPWILEEISRPVFKISLIISSIWGIEILLVEYVLVSLISRADRGMDYRDAFGAGGDFYYFVALRHLILVVILGTIGFILDKRSEKLQKETPND